MFVFPIKTLRSKRTTAPPLPPPPNPPRIPQAAFLTRQLRRSPTLVIAGFIGIHFCRVVQQPPRGAAKSTLRPKTSALPPWLPLRDSSHSQSLSFRHLLINNRSAPAMAGDLFDPEQPWRACGGEGCGVEVKEAKILGRKAAPWPRRPGSRRPPPPPTVKHLRFTSLCFSSDCWLYFPCKGRQNCCHLSQWAHKKPGG